MARGHNVASVPELPLVVDNDIAKDTNTGKLLGSLETCGVADELLKVKKNDLKAGCISLQQRKR